MSFSPERRANDFQIVLAWREGMPETRESQKSRQSDWGVFTTSSEHISGTEPVQDHNAKARAQHSTPRKCNCYGRLPGMPT